MRYVMYSRDGEAAPPRPGVLFDETIVDLPALLARLGYTGPGVATLRGFVEAGDDVWRLVRGAPPAHGDLDAPHALPLADARLHAPLADTHKLVLLAGNYREHIREVGFRVPPSAETVTPQFFMKPPSTTIIGPGDPIRLSPDSVWVDWEVELAVIVGRGGRRIPENQAMAHVFGYTILNDISERAFNSTMVDRFEREKDPFMDWLHGKWFDGFAPMGPWVVTGDAIPDPHNLRLTLHHNGVLQQDGHTGAMLHTIPYLIHKLSHIMTLEPGDVLATGTPSGVGHSKGVRVAAGDVLTCAVEGIGTLSNPVVAGVE
jgi:2-keto-4-pentenoate hydratase/2-oxohepta-3-ene-1,7-dioic acid hydratase in catechol pathway